MWDQRNTRASPPHIPDQPLTGHLACSYFTAKFPMHMQHVHSSTPVQCLLNINSKNVVEQANIQSHPVFSKRYWCHFNCTAALSNLTCTLQENYKALSKGTISGMSAEMDCRDRPPKFCCISAMPFSRKTRQ